MFIREFVPSDLARVYQIEVESFSAPYEVAILQQLYEIGAGFLVAVEDGEIVGYIIFWVKEERETAALQADPIRAAGGNHRAGPGQTAAGAGGLQPHLSGKKHGSERAGGVPDRIAAGAGRAERPGVPHPGRHYRKRKGAGSYQGRRRRAGRTY